MNMTLSIVMALVIIIQGVGKILISSGSWKNTKIIKCPSHFLGTQEHPVLVVDDYQRLIETMKH